MAPLITRRRILAAGGAAGAVALGAGVWAVTANPTDILFHHYQRLLPGVRLDEASTRAAIDDFLADHISAPKLKVVAAAWRTFGVGSMQNANAQFDIFTRQAFTYFLTNSNFFLLGDPRAEPIVYTKPVIGMACGNPFADLSPP
ncbi:MAG: hypothetical protein AB7L65_01185 [Hyphomonadaceae bacterium]